MKPGKTGISRIVDATLYSWRGFRAAFRYESAFRQELALALFALQLAGFIAQDTVQFLLLVLPGERARAQLREETLRLVLQPHRRWYYTAETPIHW
jgi:diacylglycerol kinase (ATP)